MNTDKKELLKNFKALIEDLLDHYDEYTNEEKNQIKEIFQKTAELNAILDKYDIETKFDWDEYFTVVGRCFSGS
jgi:hypothetical protein